MPALFDMQLRALRRDRAARLGPELFLLERAFGDCLERLALVRRKFGRALLIGCSDPGWRARLNPFAIDVHAADPGRLFARACGGEPIVEDAWASPEAAFDLVLAIGTLDTVNDLPRALSLIQHSLAADGLFIGAMSGGDTLPRLRSAARAADQAGGSAAAHVHPRIEPSALAALLANAGFGMPVVDVDRVQVGYRSLDGLVRDLRGMAATNILTARPRMPLGRAARAAASADFAKAADSSGRTIESFEILHFVGWRGVRQHG